ncbi:NfeD family protein [Ramlibacter humi]|uniref:Nodulation protein NfeD n=1 Tax=Ramlibacter humi TaxID=2530451 RepID=A0A4Z0C9G8_9BURK|nr:nodulation protein NfeD [Ramlibacter humi]TFZ07981.1 nodulation protein NfeD [Ramlibacter humi]
MSRALRCLLCFLVLCVFTGASAQAPAQRAVVVLEVDGAIGPASEDYLHRGLALAQREHAQLLVLQLDTPGGLDTAMRGMIKDILSSSVPVATFVAPGGARAASAGTYILYASHVAAMTPASTLGAATPVAIGLPSGGGTAPRPAASAPFPSASGPSAAEAGDALAAKRISDAAAYIRGLAQLRGRNADWAEKAVRDAASLSAPEAIQLKVVDLVATDVPDLLQKLDGRELQMGATVQRLQTRGAPVVAFDQDWRSRLLSVITNPSLALLLMMAGVYGLAFEFSSPGLVAPGVIGAICLVLALFSLHMLPVNYAGLALILLGIAFLVAEAYLPTFGVVGFGGIVAFAFGCVMLIDSDSPGYGIPLPFIAVLTAASAAFLLIVGGLAVRTRRRPVVTGPQTLVGAGGELVEYAGGTGWAVVQGEHWRVRGPDQLHAGDRVRVHGLHDGVLEIVPL